MRYLRAFYVNDMLCGKDIERLEFAPVTVFCGSNKKANSVLMNFISQNLFNEYIDIYGGETYIEQCREKFYDAAYDNVDFTEIDEWDFEEECEKEFEKQMAWFNEFIENYQIHHSGNAETYTSAQPWEVEFEDYYTGEIHALFEANDDESIALPTYVLIESSMDLFAQADEEGFDYDVLPFEQLNEKRSDYCDYNLCILDMPELCLPIDEQIKLVKYIEECAYLYGVQFIIMTSSPIMASIKEALVYDIDLETVRSVNWKDTCIAQQYNEIFNKK